MLPLEVMLGYYYIMFAALEHEKHTLIYLLHVCSFCSFSVFGDGKQKKTTIQSLT